MEDVHRALPPASGVACCASVESVLPGLVAARQFRFGACAASAPVSVPSLDHASPGIAAGTRARPAQNRAPDNVAPYSIAPNSELGTRAQ